MMGGSPVLFKHSLGPRNNWSDNNVVQEAGGSTYSATSACGQLHQSYQVWSKTVAFGWNGQLVEWATEYI